MIFSARPWTCHPVAARTRIRYFLMQFPALKPNVHKAAIQRMIFSARPWASQATAARRTICRDMCILWQYTALSLCREEMNEMPAVGPQSAANMKAARKKPKAHAAPMKKKLKKASFRRGKKRLRKIKRREQTEKIEETEKMFNGYNLLKLEVPRAAWPQGPCKGLHSYTVKAPNESAIEVLCRNKAFYCKKVHPSLAEDPAHKKGQVGWKTFGSVAAAWRVAKERVGWDLK